jgi:hypothetical protein
VTAGDLWFLATASPMGDDVLATDGTNLIRVHVGSGQIAPDIAERAIAALAQE